MRASDFRRTARQALSGKWITAAIATLVMMVLGVVSTDGVSINFDLDAGAQVSFFNRPLITLFGENGPVDLLLGAYLGAMAVAVIILGIVLFILRSVVDIGYARFHLDIVEGSEARVETLFSQLHSAKSAVLTAILVAIACTVGCLLLIVPGIILSYTYAMTSYILAENPGLPAREVLRRSREMMRGNRWRLFCLQFSFIGWNILAAFVPFNLGRLALSPYIETATAAFYKDLTDGRPKTSGDPWDF